MIRLNVLNLPLPWTHTYPDVIIPGNDDSSKAVTLYARGIADAILEGRANAVNDIVKAVGEGDDEFVEVDEAASA